MPVAEPDIVGRLQRREPSGFLLASVRGVGQVDLQPLLWTGVLILAALWSAGWRIGLFATLGTLISTATAYVLRVDRSNIALGLQGYCGCLTGIALVTYLGHHPATYVLAVVGAIVCTLLTATLTTFLSPYGLTALTAPFCLVSGVMVLGAPSFGRIWHGAPKAVSDPTSGDTGISWSDLWHAFFTNVSQIFLVDAWYVGLIMLVGLALAGVRVFLYAAAGSVMGIVAAWALGAPTAQIAQGIYGYNAVLVAIALGAVFLTGTVANGVYALFGAAATTGLTASLTSLFKPFGGHTFTWPFILTTWALMAAVPLLPRLRRSA
ncbi:urea transporter [Streptomyces sp. NPDC053741]|uniref:Urea transporter n=1 Tax=[Kitasatospora] papulosa TaxID=1464011 RepID=A0ABZ1K4P2_9ACTN|nr:MULTISPECIES: urea transporter [Streptomyces]MYT58300.1 urea transporter [Streptomyces sp. SID7834]MDF6061891.1 urea transporter [Streptomyces sp. JH010]MDX2620918.1 urea transporter [Streptomyces sp. WI03-5b]MDX3185997.1 urea transporter [Streptomyces sp. ME02-7008A-1]MDX3306081.1 urea transporter [Streptomyces sp. ME02-7008A]